MCGDLCANCFLTGCKASHWFWVHWPHSFLPFPPDDGTFLEHTPPSSSGGEGEGAGEVTLVSCPPSAPVPALAPSLTPASQPTISLLTDNSSDTLSVESLTLLPPADSPHLHPCAAHIPITHSLLKADTAIPEEEEGDDEEKEMDKTGHLRGGEEEEELREEDGSLMDETETDATLKEETTTMELITPTDEAPEEPDRGDELEEEDTPSEVNTDKEPQERDNCATTEEAEIHNDAPDSPELD